MARFYYGGQAIMEGVMMRGRRGWAAVVRAPNGKLVAKEEPLEGALYGSKVKKIPFLRGLALLWETLNLGMRTLLWSANVALAEEQVELSKPMMAGTVATSLAFAIGLFFVVPLLAVGAVDRFITSSFASNLIEGLIRLAVFVGYLAVIGKMPDIARVFSYHGAEHKTINAFEANAPLTPQAVKTFTRAHPRCGTTFLFEVLVISIFVFALLGRPPMLERIISRIVLVPLVAAVSYEFLRLGAGAYHIPLIRILLSPFLALQSLTTREPDEDMIAVAIEALKRVLMMDGAVLTDEAEAEMAPAALALEATATAAAAAGDPA